MQALSRPILFWSSSTCPFSSFYFEFSVQIPVKTASIDNMFLVLLPFFFSFFFFVCQTWRSASLPFDATSSHAFACYCVEQQDYIHYKLFIVFKEMCYWTALHAGHVWFFFLCLKMSFLSDDSSMAFILHLWPPHFFGKATKKWQDFPPPL